MTDPLFDLALAEAGKAADLAINNEDVNEAASNTVAWASITLERLISHGTPAIHASSLILGVIHTNLMAKLLQPPEGEGRSDDPAT